LRSGHEDALLVAYSDDQSGMLGDEEMKVCVEGGLVRDISKAIDPNRAEGENVGIVKFGPAGATALVGHIDSLIAGGARLDWAPRAFREFARNRPLHAIGTGGRPWIEIDFPEDYRKAVEEILPLIVNDGRPCGGSRIAIASGGERRDRVEHEL
jgi:choline kinase